MNSTDTAPDNPSTAADAAPPNDSPGGRSWLARAWIPALLAVLAVATRVYSIEISGGFRGYLNPDEGAYFGSSFGLVNGLMPYRDFLLLHPPGSSVAYSPAAALSWLVGEPNSFAAARLLVVLIGATSTVLAYNVARRVGMTAAVAAGLMYAVWYPVVRTERTTLLEPLVNLALLGALLLLNDKRLTTRRIIAAGVICGLGISVKLWLVFPAAVLFIWVFTKGWRRAVIFFGSVAAGFAVIVLPFLIAAPDSMVRMVVLDQLGRSRNDAATVIDRLALMLDVKESVFSNRPLAILAWLLIVVAAGLVVWKVKAGRPWVALLAVCAGVLLLSPTFFLNYTAFIAVPLVLVIGCAAQLVADGLGSWRSDLSRVAAGVVVVVSVGALALLGRAILDPAGNSFPVKPATAAAKGGTCVTSDSATGIILTGHFTKNVDAGCPVVVDFTGYVYETRGLPLSRERNTEWQAQALRYLQQGDRIIIMRIIHDGFTKASLQNIARRPVLFTSRYVTVYGPLPAAR